MDDIEAVPAEPSEENGDNGVRKTVFPLSKIKAICKCDEDVKMVRTDAVELIALATEMFLEILAEEGMRGAASKSRLAYTDIAESVRSIEAFQFLSDVIPPTKGTLNLGQFFRESAPTKPLAADSDDGGDNAIAQDTTDKEAVDSDGGLPDNGTPVSRRRRPTRRRQLLSDDSESESQGDHEQHNIDPLPNLTTNELSKPDDTEPAPKSRILEIPVAHTYLAASRQTEIKASRLSALEAVSSSEDEDSQSGREEKDDSDNIEEFDGDTQPPPVFS